MCACGRGFIRAPLVTSLSADQLASAGQSSSPGKTLHSRPLKVLSVSSTMSLAMLCEANWKRDFKSAGTEAKACSMVVSVRDDCSQSNRGRVPSVVCSMRAKLPDWRSARRMGGSAERGANLAAADATRSALTNEETMAAGIEPQ